MQPLTYLEFELEMQRAGDRYVARIIHSPAGEATQVFSLPFSQDKLENLVLKLGSGPRSTRTIHSPEMEAAKELGGKLFDAVFAGDLRACFKSSLDHALEEEGRGLRIKLRLQEVPQLADIPWEYLFDSSTDRFFAQSNQTPIVRYLSIREKVPALAVTFPLRIVVMVSSPSDYARLDVEREKSKINEALKDLAGAGKIQLEFLESATLTALVHSLRKQDCHVFHYIGHGGFDKQSEEGVLVLEDDRGRSWLAGAHRVGTVLHDCRSLRLAVLNACEGARNSQTDPFAGLAASAVRQGIPAVVGMQFEITDQAAIIFAREFYGAIADGFPVDAALAEARKIIYLAPNDVEWGTPVLYMRSPDGVLFTMAEAPPPAPPPPSPPLSPSPEDAEAYCKRAEQCIAVQDYEGAVRLYRKAAEWGYSIAQNNLGTMYEAGHGVSQDYNEAVKWYRMAAKQGDDMGQLNLAGMYEGGHGVPQDYNEAIKWYQKAAEQGQRNVQTKAQNKLGWIYQNGLGVSTNDREAVKWYRMAADQGLDAGQNNLGWMYMEGRGVPQDYKEAVKWYRKAATQGHAAAQFNLSVMYYTGRGVPRDVEEAVKCLRMAATQGYAAAQEGLRKLGQTW
jgi:TPR repeat protein